MAERAFANRVTTGCRARAELYANSVIAGLPLARLIGNASGFLQFTGGLPFDLRLTSQTYLLSAATALLSLLRLQGFANAYAGITRRNPGSVGRNEAVGFTPVGVRYSTGLYVCENGR